MVYISDIFTAVTMLSTTSWSNAIFNSCPPKQENGCVSIPFSIGRWLFFGCVIFSFLLVCFVGCYCPSLYVDFAQLGHEVWKTKKIVQSRNISYAFTNVMANNYYSLRKLYSYLKFDIPILRLSVRIL